LRLQCITWCLMRTSPLEDVVLFHIGPLAISGQVVTTWAIMIALVLGSSLLVRQLSIAKTENHSIVEMAIMAFLDHISAIVGRDARPLLPLLLTLFLFLIIANLSGVLPGIEAPTAKLETPAALAVIVFFSVHFFGIRSKGLLGYLASFAKPKAIMLPLNLMSEITRTFSLSVRLFGNVMSGGFVIALIVALAGLFVPIPFMALEILLGLVQAYIFTVLATVFIGAAIDKDIRS